MDEMTMDEVAGTCDACQQMSKVIGQRSSSAGKIINKKSEPVEDVVKLGGFQDLATRTHCTTCQEIVRAIIHDGRQPPPHATLYFSSKNYETAFTPITIHTDESRLTTDEGEILDLGLYPIKPSSLVPTDLGGRVFDQQIDISLIRRWISCCQESHSSCCLSSGLPPPSHQIYLIDVNEGCLVLKPAQTRYIALSYVWGNATVATTTKSNLENLKRPGNIGPDVELLAIPRTIRDALRLVSLLNERYLWVDAFCIVQDDEHTKQAHLNSMASIYANSVFTVVAAEGDDADHGLLGIPGVNEARNVACDIIRLQSGQKLLAYRFRAWYPETTTWESRAWTFQEALFSRRLLIFNGLVSWFCRMAIWEEHISQATEDLAYAKAQGPNSVQIHFAGQIPNWPDLDYWSDLTKKFTSRKLTYDDDSVNAFAGATSVFDRVFSGGIIWGMPEMFFDYVMLWIPRTVLRRRQRSIKPSGSYFPSWSWVGWEGMIESFGALSPILSKTTVGNRVIEIQPVIQWYQSQKSIQGRFPIKNIYPSLYDTYAKDKMREVPPS